MSNRRIRRYPLVQPRFHSPRRARQAERSTESGASDRIEWISLGISSALTATLVWVAVAQWKVSEKQTEIAESLQKLEFARSTAPRIEFKAAGKTIKFQKFAGSVELPEQIEVLPAGGISAIQKIDVDVRLLLVGGNTTGCSLRARDLYLYGNRKLNLIADVRDRLDHLLTALGKAGISVMSIGTEAKVQYVDIFKATNEVVFDVEESSLIDGNGLTDAPVLYNGMWSSQPGLYFDEGEKFDGDCQKLAGVLRTAQPPN
jgi:hypothetical protein